MYDLHALARAPIRHRYERRPLGIPRAARLIALEIQLKRRNHAK